MKLKNEHLIEVKPQAGTIRIVDRQRDYRWSDIYEEAIRKRSFKGSV